MSNTNMNEKWYETSVAKQILEKKYFHEGETTFNQFVDRVSNIFDTDILKREVKEAIEAGDFIPAGRTLYGAGSKGKFKASLSNCYISDSVKDNLESIFDVASKMARIFSMGGGVGLNVSNLRPRGAKVNNAARTSTGAVSFLNLFNTVGETIGAHGRRAAIMLGMSCDHPDIEEFLEAKNNNTEIQSANLSILFTDEFMQAVTHNTQFELKFTVGATGEVIKKTIDAHKFFMKFCKYQWRSAEPGALYIDKIRNSNILSGYPEDQYKIEITNPCFTGDMKLLTENGFKNFIDLNNKNVNVRSYDGSVSVGKVWCSGEKDTVKLKMRNANSITCTPNHVFMTTDKKEVMAKDLKGLQIMPYIDSSNRSDNLFYEKIGFIQGDGQLSRLKSNTHQGIEVNIGEKDGEILDLFECTQADLLGNKRTVYLNGFNDKLRELGFSENVLFNRAFPNTYNDWTYDQKTSFLRGCYSANGCVMNGKRDFRVQYKTTCKQFAEQLVINLAEFGIDSYITTNKPKVVKFNNGDYECKESYDINIAKYESKVTFYNIIGFIQAYKETTLFQLLLQHAPIVSSIEPNGIQKVYDFSEPNNHWGVVEGFIAHNCAEYCGSAYNACNLGSINLYNMVKNPFTPEASIDFDKLTLTTNLGIRALDDILDYGLDMQPLPENRQAVIDWRAVGLGIFGLGDALVALGIEYGSPESIDIVSEITEHILQVALMTSCDLARSNEPFEKYNWEYIKKSPIIQKYKGTQIYDDIKEFGLRNGSLLSVAPTGTIATMMGLSGGAEPLYAISYERTTHALEKSGETFKVFAKSVEDLLAFHGLPATMPDTEISKKFPYVITSHEINPLQRIKVQASMQEYVDNSISSTVNLKESATVQDIYELYMAAWKSGCKGITVFRDNCARTSILGKEHDRKPVAPLDNTITFDKIHPAKRSNIKKLSGSTIVKSTACVPKMYVTCNIKDNEVFEVFTAAATGCKSNIGNITRLASLALRSGVAVEEVVKELRENICPACTVLKQQGKDICLSCGNAIADAIEEAYEDINGTQKPTDKHMAICPSCGEHGLIPEGKCVTCKCCGWSKCE